VSVHRSVLPSQVLFRPHFLNAAEPWYGVYTSLEAHGENSEMACQDSRYNVSIVSWPERKRSQLGLAQIGGAILDANRAWIASA
jgi:hypothetical protein